MKQIISIIVVGVVALFGGFALGANWSPIVVNQVTQEPGFVGAGAHSQSVKQAATAPLTSNAVTTTVFTNNTSGEVILDKVSFFASSTAPGFLTATPTLSFAISADGTNVTTNLAFFPNAVVAGGWSTTTVTYVATSTFSNPSLRRVPAGSSVLCFSSAGTVTTTQGYCSAEYTVPTTGQ